MTDDRMTALAAPANKDRPQTWAALAPHTSTCGQARRYSPQPQKQRGRHPPGGLKCPNDRWAELVGFIIYSGAHDVIGQFAADDIERRPHGQCRSVPKINAEIFELCAQGLVERPADAGESMHGLISLTRYAIEYA